MISPNRLFSLAAGLPPWFERTLMALVCWQLAGLTWWLFAPSTAGPMPTPPRPAPVAGESRDALLGWFGGETPADAQTANEKYALTAVIAGPDGVAVFKDGAGKSFAVRAGDAIDSASRLLFVAPGSATMEHGRERREIHLPQPESASPKVDARTGALPVKAASAKSSPLAKSSPQAKPPQTIRVSRGRMAGMMQGGNVTDWDSGLSSAPDGGIRVDHVPPFARLLQLRDGDVLKKVNQRPLTQLADVSLIVFHFGQDASVELELIRHGASTILHYEIQP
jgi:S1-C subfamily serine protease